MPGAERDLPTRCDRELPARCRAIWSRIAGVVIIRAFIASGALSASPGGVGLIWITVLATWTWLTIISIAAYRAIPHPVIARRRMGEGA